MTEVEINALSDYRQSCKETLTRSEETFEKQISFISSGALGFTVLLVDKLFTNFSSTKWKLILIIGLTFLVACLTINLYSHIVAANNKRNNIDEIDEEKYSFTKDQKRDKRLKYINIVSFVSLIIGILLILNFIYINLITVSKEIHKPSSNPDYFEKGERGQKGPKIEQAPPVQPQTSSAPTFQRK